MWNWPNCRFEVWINQLIPVLPVDSLRVDCTEVAVIEMVFGFTPDHWTPRRTFYPFLSIVESAQHIACIQYGVPMPCLDHPALL